MTGGLGRISTAHSILHSVCPCTHTPHRHPTRTPHHARPLSPLGFPQKFLTMHKIPLTCTLPHCHPTRNPHCAHTQAPQPPHLPLKNSTTCTPSHHHPTRTPRRPRTPPEYPPPRIGSPCRAWRRRQLQAPDAAFGREGKGRGQEGEATRRVRSQRSGELWALRGGGRWEQRPRPGRGHCPPAQPRRPATGRDNSSFRAAARSPSL